MKKIIVVMTIMFILLIPFSAYAINFSPETTYNSVVVVYSDTGVGSGFYISENTIITNAHVVGNNSTVSIMLYNDESVKGNVIKTDTDKDLALVAISKTGVPLNISEETLSVGQEVYAIGAPKDMPYTMTKGIISAMNRKIGQNEYIQMDASVNPGNSGGPLLDENGNVIGVITLKASDAEGIGFAVTISDVRAFTSDVDFENQQNYPQENRETNADTSTNHSTGFVLSAYDGVIIALLV